jgi:hypothetical protein
MSRRSNESYKGRYTPKNPQKYKGNAELCIFRSLWERKFMIFCDENSSVVEWSSEEIVVPYISPVDGRRHRYFVDFWVKVQSKEGDIKEYLIEVKPKAQTKQPEPPKSKRVSKSKLIEMRNWMVNNAKWNAAREVCADKGWEFKILTEDNLFGKD